MTTAQLSMLRAIAEGKLAQVPTEGTPGRCWRSLAGKFAADSSGVPHLLPAGHQVLARRPTATPEQVALIGVLRAHLARERAIRALLDKVLGNRDSGGPKGFDLSTPTRISHFTEMLRDGVDVDLVEDALERLNASGWCKKPAQQVTPGDLDRLRRERPWEREGQGRRGGARQEKPALADLGQLNLFGVDR